MNCNEELQQVLLLTHIKRFSLCQTYYVHTGADKRQNCCCSENAALPVGNILEASYVLLSLCRTHWKPQICKFSGKLALHCSNNLHQKGTHVLQCGPAIKATWSGLNAVDSWSPGCKAKKSQFEENESKNRVASWSIAVVRIHIPRWFGGSGWNPGLWKYVLRA